MLILTRKIGEEVVIDGNIIITVMDIKGGRIKLAFKAPDDVSIIRPDAMNKRKTT